MKQYLYTAQQIADTPPSVRYRREYPGTPLSVVGLACPEDRPGHWGTSVVSIYRGDRLLGGYRRLYSSFGADTFSPFFWEGAWYALYSANYTCTRVLRLLDDGIEDWCGEEPGTDGFCPVEYYAPQGFQDNPRDPGSIWMFDNERDFPTYDAFAKQAAEERAAVKFPGFAFLAGCHWGDDHEWKLRYVDYSQVTGRRLIIDERFGYHELPHRALRECVDLQNWTLDDPLIYADRRIAYRPKCEPLG
jgi:hypothetical protein